MSSLIQSLKRGSKIGEELFASSSKSSYRSSYLSVDNGKWECYIGKTGSLKFPLSISYGSEEQLDESDHGIEDNISDYEDKEMVDSSIKAKVRIHGKELDYRSAVTKYCNQGKTNFLTLM